jgi:hypothetical protein
MEAPDFTIHAVERGGRWVARAVRVDSGEPFGIECTGASEADAVARVSRWLEWQRDHVTALEALQAAERAYHRAMGGAFTMASDQAAARSEQDAVLREVQAACTALDAIRSRKPSQGPAPAED